FFAKVGLFIRKYYKTQTVTADHLIDLMWKMVAFHTEIERGKHTGREPHELYRIYYYDSPPLDKQVKLPHAENGQTTPKDKNFKAEPMNKLRSEFHTKLKGTRKTALRMGKLQSTDWKLNDNTLKDLRNGRRKWEDLTNADWYYEVNQKGVDVKLGMDITILSYEKLVDVIVLIAGDSDFVPAAKQARIKGVDFILNPLKQDISEELSEHIDGIQSFSIGVGLAEILKCTPDNNPAWWQEYQNNKIARQSQQKAKTHRSRKSK
ncbi:NYN domain-containing protein, partial [Glaesserella parasuis]|uniref:NYN domain-containing protein n=1 Tax=Glaesserella parasuis TaxID=738 RepID=UPI0038548F0A